MMRDMTTSSVLISMVVAVIFVGTLFVFPLNVDAKQELSAVEGAAYNVHSSLSENLKTFMGKKVYVTLDCGKVFAGYVKEIGEHLVHLEKLDGKDYFDALIPINRISAIDTRFRQPKR